MANVTAHSRTSLAKTISFFCLCAFLCIFFRTLFSWCWKKASCAGWTVEAVEDPKSAGLCSEALVCEPLTGEPEVWEVWLVLLVLVFKALEELEGTSSWRVDWFLEDRGPQSGVISSWKETLLGSVPMEGLGNVALASALRLLCILGSGSLSLDAASMASKSNWGEYCMQHSEGLSGIEAVLPTRVVSGCPSSSLSDMSVRKLVPVLGLWSCGVVLSWGLMSQWASSALSSRSTALSSRSDPPSFHATPWPWTLLCENFPVLLLAEALGCTMLMWFQSWWESHLDAPWSLRLLPSSDWSTIDPSALFTFSNCLPFLPWLTHASPLWSILIAHWLFLALLSLGPSPFGEDGSLTSGTCTGLGDLCPLSITPTALEISLSIVLSTLRA